MKEKREVVYLIGWKDGHIEPLTISFTRERAIRHARFRLEIHPEYDAIELTTPDGQSVAMVERKEQTK